MQIQESNQDLENEITISNSSLQVKLESHVGDEHLNITIVVRKPFILGKELENAQTTFISSCKFPIIFTFFIVT